MKFGTATAAQLAETGRWDARFHLLLNEHRPLTGELVGKFTTAELVKLATNLPFDGETANVVWLREGNLTRAKMLGLPGFVNTPEDNSWFKTHLALYCAAASQAVKDKVAKELAELTRQKIAKLDQLKALCDLAAAKGADALKAAFDRDPDPKDE